MAHNRYACLADLSNYFKKSELFAGLTAAEQKLARHNLGIIDYTGEGGQTEPQEITYNSLLSLVTNNNLVTGARYIITDFQTIYSSNTLDANGKRITWGLSTVPSQSYRLIVTALTNGILDDDAVIEGKNWEVKYDITPETLEDGIPTKGRITYLCDENNNSAYYDFKNIKFRRQNILGVTGNFYTFSDIVNGEIVDSSELHNTRDNVILKGSINNVFIGDTYNNIIQTNCTGNTFIKGCHDTLLGWDSVDNVFNEPVRYTSGSIYNKTFLAGDTTLSTTITKTIQKVNDATIVSFLDPITYSYQVIIV